MGAKLLNTFVKMSEIGTNFHKSDSGGNKPKIPGSIFHIKRVSCLLKLEMQKQSFLFGLS